VALPPGSDTSASSPKRVAAFQLGEQHQTCPDHPFDLAPAVSITK